MPFFLTDDAVKLYYEVTGQGSKTLILVHGWSASHQFFKRQIPELSKTYRIVSYDLRGHGQSEISENGYTIARYAQDLKNLIDFLQLKDVSIVGWSMGTHIIFDYVKQFGCDNLSKLVLVDMSAKLITDDTYNLGLYGKFTHEDNLGVLVAINEDWGKFMDVFVPAIYAKSGCKNPEDLKWNFEEGAKNSTTVMARMWITMSSQDYRDMLSKITVPVLVTYGEESCLYPAENSQYIGSQIPDAKVVGFPGCGHGLMLESPEKFNQEIRNFLG